MRLLNVKTLKLHEFFGKAIPEYGILSHRWEDEEVTFEDLKIDPSALRGWTKVSECCTLAAHHELEYVWMDTCCIDKSSSAELTEAVNSMWQWYKNAAFCYVFLCDVTYNENADWEAEFIQSKWFTRGWTLQELLAPKKIQFYDCCWRPVGDRWDLRNWIHEATRISWRDLEHWREASIAQRMSWASKRETSREEDVAYCLMGLFDVNMPLLYGEGSDAFLRLQYEIIKQSDDESIFAWHSNGKRSGLLASTPADFENSACVFPYAFEHHKPYFATNKGISIAFELQPYFPDGREGVKYWRAALNCIEGHSTITEHPIIHDPKPVSVFLAAYQDQNVYRISDKLYTPRFCRVGPWLGDAPFSIAQNASPLEIYVKQKDSDEWKLGFNGLSASYKPPSQRSALHARKAPPDSVWHIKDARIEEARLHLGMDLSFPGIPFPWQGRRKWTRIGEWSQREVLKVLSVLVASERSGNPHAFISATEMIEILRTLYQSEGGYISGAVLTSFSGDTWLSDLSNTQRMLSVAQEYRMQHWEDMLVDHSSLQEV